MAPHGRRAVDVYDVVYLVLVCLYPAEIMGVRQVCRLWADACDAAVVALVSPYRVLSPYFRAVLAFRSLMATFNIVACGSRVLELFDPFGSSPATEASGLDLFVEQCDAHALDRYLEREGYFVVADSARLAGAPDVGRGSGDPLSLDFPYRSLVDLHRRFVLRVTRWSNGMVFIDVGITAWTPLMAVFHFACTADMNFMTWDAAFCFFPKATLIDRIAVVLAAQHRTSSRCCAKWELRGFRVLPWQESRAGAAYGLVAGGCRWLGDSRAWCIPLPVDGIPAEGSSGERMWMANGVHLSYLEVHGPRLPGQSPLWVARLETSPLEHPALSTHTYAVPSFIVTKFDAIVDSLRARDESLDITEAIPRLLAWYEDGDSDSDVSAGATASDYDSDSSVA